MENTLVPMAMVMGDPFAGNEVLVGHDIRMVGLADMDS